MALLAYFLTQKSEPTAGRDVNRIDNSGGFAVIQPGNGTIVINQGERKPGFDLAEYGAIAKQLGVTEQALKNFFVIIEQQKVPLDDLDAKLREIAAHYKTLLSSVRALSSDDPEVTQLRNEAEIALKAGEFARAEDLLNEASAKDIAAIQALAEQQARLQVARKQRQLSAASAKAANGDLKDTQLAYVEAAAYYRQAMELLPDDEPRALARYLNEQGMALYSAGHYTEARPSLENALAIYEKILGPDHPDTALSLNNLGVLLQGQGKFTEAQPYYARALAIWEKVLGPDHSNTAFSLNNLAELYRVQGRYAEALPLYRRALACREKTLGPEHDDTLSSMNALALALFGQGDVAEARQLQEKLLEVHQRLHGPGHPNTLISMNNLAEVLRAQGELDAARTLLEPALDAMKRQLGPQHPRTLACLHNLAETLRVQGEVATARPMLTQALEARQQVLGARHPDTTVSAGALWETLYTLGEAAAAETLAAEHLQWLLEADEATLAAHQRKVRGQLQQRLGTARVQAR